MPDHPPISDEAVEEATAKLGLMVGSDSTWAECELTAFEMLRAAAPHLYRDWAERLVERIRTEGAKDWQPDGSFKGDLHERIADEAGSWSGEFWGPQDVADGCARYVADLLGVDGEGS